MDLSKRKYQLIEKVLALNEPVLEKLEAVLKEEQGNTGEIDIEQYNKELDEANERINKGEFYTHEQVEEMAKKW